MYCSWPQAKCQKKGPSTAPALARSPYSRSSRHLNQIKLIRTRNLDTFNCLESSFSVSAKADVYGEIIRRIQAAGMTVGNFKYMFSPTRTYTEKQE